MRVDHEQARLRAREARPRLDQDERAPVGGQPARRPVVGDGRDRPRPGPRLHAHDLPAAAPCRLHDRLLADRHGHVPDGAARSCDPRRPYVDVQHREPVGRRAPRCERRENESGGDDGQHAHASNTRAVPGEVPPTDDFRQPVQSNWKMADLGIVDALARLQLAARRSGYEVAVTAAPSDLVELIELAGLSDVLGVEPRRQAEEREERLGVEEERELPDSAV